MEARLNAIEQKIDFLIDSFTRLPDTIMEAVRAFVQNSVPEDQRVYTPDEFAKLVDKTGGTVRDWCKGGRVNARHIDERAGDKWRWRITHQELVRYRNDGLLPEDKERNR